MKLSFDGNSIKKYHNFQFFVPLSIHIQINQSKIKFNTNISECVENFV